MTLALIFASALIFMVVVADRQDSDPIVGMARVVDGDSLEVAGKKIRIVGIDAPELDQACNNQGQVWSCGQESKTALRTLIGSNLVHCSNQGKDKYRRTLSVCEVAGKDVGKWMVTNGWAVSYGDYKFDEAIARRNRLGMWQGEFELPKSWRNKSELDASFQNPVSWLVEKLGF